MVNTIWKQTNSERSGATSASFTTPAVTAAMGGTEYRVVVSSGGKSITTGAATLIADAVPPAVVLANGSPDLKQVTVTFNEELDQASATAAGNYTIDKGVTVSSAALDETGKVVTLTTSTQTGGTDYTLTVNGVKDVAGNPANTTAPFKGATTVTGALRVDLWFDISGTALDELFADPRYPDNPDETLYWTSFGPFASGTAATIISRSASRPTKTACRQPSCSRIH